MSHQAIERLYADHGTVLDFLRKQGEVSSEQTVNEDFRKVLVLAAASFFEHQICDILLAYVNRKCSADSTVVSMVKNKVVKRQYHTYFDWENKKAGPFFALLGEQVGDSIKKSTKEGELKAALEAFLELGYLRNCLVHQNFVTFAFEKTAEEVWGLYCLGKKFIEHVDSTLTSS